MKKTVSPWHNLRILAICAILSAFSIVFGKYLAINLGDTIRFSFENLPILLAGLYLGPIAGGAVGAVADLVGCVLVGYSINPIITLGAVSIGLVAGFSGILLRKSPILRVLCAVIPAHVLGSVLIKTIGLWVYYQTPFLQTVALRSLNYLPVAAAEFVILFILTKNRSFSVQFQSFISPSAPKGTRK